MDTWVCTTCQWDKRKVSMVGLDDITIDNVDPLEGATHHFICGDSCAMWALRIK
jgi:hypothetical protein